MYTYIHNGVSCRKLVALLFWLWNFLSLVNVNFRSVSASSSVNSTHVVSSTREPNLVGEARESISLGLLRTTSNPYSPDFYDKEEFPLWIIVLIVVTGGLFLVACILCLIKLRRWKNDHGTYSMWNSQGPSVEAMFARESGVLFERLDIETSLAEAQCYEIPVDSFETPQRVYIDGIRFTPLAESLETPVSQLSLSQAEINIVDQTQYCAANERSSVSTDVTAQRESIPSSTGPDTSQRSSLSTISEPATPSQESPKDLYPKPLPVIPVEDTPSVLCETYTLDVDVDDDRVSAIANRPLPQTPHLSPPPVKYSAASLDRSLLKQQKEANLEKPNTFRTLPRPRKIRQIPLPFLNAISRSASSSDVSKEAGRLSDHVASDTKICTLTRIKKRMSQSVDTLIESAERVSHFYENPYLVEGAGSDLGKGGEPSGTHLEPPYSRVSSIPTASDENLPKDKEHLYTRISQYMDGQEYFNRHSYASVRNPSFRTRPRSKHVYISIVFGSADSVCIPSLDNPKTDSTKRTKSLSKSCPSLNVSTQHNNPNITPRPNSYYPSTETSGGLYSIDTRDVKTQVPNGDTNDLMSFPDSQYQNIRESIGIPILVKPVPQGSPGANPNNGYQNLQESMDTSQNSAEVYKTPKSLNVRPYYENITCVRDDAGWENIQDNGIDTSHYGVPKSPPIPLNRFCEILTTSGKVTSPQDAASQKVAASEDDGGLEVLRRKRGAENADDCAKNGERETLSTYLEGRFNGEVETPERTAEMSSTTDQNNEPTYENFISTKRDSCVSEESASSRVSLGSSLSIEDKEIYENQPLIQKTSDVNGNSVCDGFVEKLEVRGKSLVESTFFGESVA